MIGERWRWLLVVLLAMAFLFGVVRQSRADDLLLPALTSLQGDFAQTITDDNDNLLSRSEGRFALARPDKVRWEVTAPGQQLLLTDGTVFWQYDRDLETLTRSPVDRSSDSPLGLLMASESELADRYDIRRDDEQIILRPLAENGLFQSVTITLTEGVPDALLLVDNLDQRISIKLTVSKAAPEADLFVFEPPEGIEIQSAAPF